jgi:hypothetical protein
VAEDKGLHPRNVEWFIDATRQKPTVLSVERESERIFRVTRDRDELTVYLANIYTLGKADVDEILAKTPDIDVIVNVNAYNTHSQSAKDLATARGVALFRISEIHGSAVPLWR